MGKTNRLLSKQADQGINFKRIARDLMLRDTDGEGSKRFKPQTVTPKIHKAEKYRKDYRDLED
jgi:hypothetical protein